MFPLNISLATINNQASLILHGDEAKVEVKGDGLTQRA